jgi:hypothetical protein
LLVQKAGHSEDEDEGGGQHEGNLGAVVDVMVAAAEVEVRAAIK